ncbi:MAG: hypothetical protein ABTQ93_01645 [Candidatus Competibacter denitrificans]
MNYEKAPSELIQQAADSRVALLRDEPPIPEDHPIQEHPIAHIFFSFIFNMLHDA